MTRVFMFLFMAAVLVFFAAVDFDALGGDSVLGWICQDSLAICRGVDRFLHF